MQRAYLRHRATYTHDGYCEFCNLTNDSTQVLKRYEYFWFVANIFPYDMWDGYRVLEHMMFVPIRHVDSLSDFSKAEQLEYVRLLVTLEKLGYSVYARSAGSKSKSIAHQHTHLMKLSDKHVDTVVFDQRLGRRLLG